MLFSELKEEVFILLDEDSSDPSYWTEEDVEDALNEAYEEITDHSEWYETSQNFTVYAHRTYHDLRYMLSDPSSFLRVAAVYNLTTNRWLEPTNKLLLDLHSYREWETVSVTEPQCWFMRGLWWLGLFPRKASDTANAIKVFLKRMPTALANESDEPGFFEDLHDALVDYAVYDLLCQDHEFNKAQKYFDRFLTKAEDLKNRVEGRVLRDRVSTITGLA
jgi:hypothetical protein